MHFAGIDWADDHHDIVVLDANGEVVKQLRIEQSGVGLDKLCAELKRIADPADIACIIETRHGILVNHLYEEGFKVYPVNPKTVDRHRSPARAKTDKIDAAILARHGRNELPHLRRLEQDNPIIQGLKLLTRDQVALIQQQTRLVNQLTACLKEYYPVALDIFCKLNQPTTLAFLQAFPTPDHLTLAGLAGVETFLRQRRYPRPEQLLDKLRLLLQQRMLHSNSVVAWAKSRLMLALVAQLAPLGDAIRAYDKDIEDLFRRHSDSKLFQSLPGAGGRLASRLLAEWGDNRTRYESHESVAALAGTSAVPYQSGRIRRARKRYACVKSFRAAMYQFAWLSTQQEPWAKEYYDRKRSEGKSHSVAVRSLSNQWVRIMYRMWIEREPYSREKYMAARARHALAA